MSQSTAAIGINIATFTPQGAAHFMSIEKKLSKLARQREGGTMTEFDKFKCLLADNCSTSYTAVQW
jgi:hypothetical protein